MKLEDFKTPIADEIWDRHSEDGDDFSYDMYLSHRAVEKKLALAVAALKDIRTADDDCVCDSEYSANTVAIETLAQIESK